jgi:branched-chain amino acid transport system substrate-binding protein
VRPGNGPGNASATRELCPPSILRTSFTDWQPAYGMVRALGKQGVQRAAWITWDYAAGMRPGRAAEAAFAPPGAKWCPN